jgi:hypothetical protein
VGGGGGRLDYQIPISPRKRRLLVERNCILVV